GMVTGAMAYNAVLEQRERWARATGSGPPWEARYLASLEGQATLAEPLRRQAAQVGMDRAQRWLALSDAGSGLEDWLRCNFGRVEAVILGFYHFSGHLGEMAQAWPGPRSEGAEEQHRLSAPPAS